MLRHIFRGRKVLLGVSGGIAAYKIAELVRLLVKEGASVQVLMTESATHFVSPLTFQALSGQAVPTGLFDVTEEARVGHIAIADRADAVMVAPATANIIAKLAVGIADDLLTTVLMATRAPICVAPSMNVNMFEDARLKGNLKRLVELGFRIAEPGEGFLACGYEGKGRLAEPPELLEELSGLLVDQDFKGRRLLVSAGPTWETIDLVRHIANRSSGKMGYALARAARRRGAEVTLVTGPSALPAPRGVRTIAVVTAAEMRRAVLRGAEDQDAVIMAAAVSDFRVLGAARRKVRRGGGKLTIHLEPTQDILAELAGKRGKAVLVGFAAEVGNLVKEARQKLKRKGVDLIVANDVTEKGAGFDSDTNIVTLVGRSGKAERLPRKDKDEVADRILDRLAKLLPMVTACLPEGE